MNIKNYILAFFILFSESAFGQASYSYQFAFKLYDNGKAVDFETFCKEYKFANVYGDIVDVCDTSNFQTSFHYAEKNAVYYVRISTIGSRFSFALYHNGKAMAFFFPFKITGQSYYYCDALEFNSGNFYFDFSEQELAKTDLDGSDRFYQVGKLDYDQLRKAFRKSDYHKRAAINYQLKSKQP